MPSVSQSQQKLMAQAYQVRKWKDSNGKEGTDPDSIEKEYRDQIVSLADSMTKKQLQDFAETKIKDLPKKVKENLTGFLSGGPFPQFHSFVANVAPQLPYANRDRKDELVKRFIEFIDKDDKKKKKEKTNEAVAAVVPVGTAQVNNTPGMGNATPPSAGNVGSGDRFDSTYSKSNTGIMSYEEYKKWLKKWHKKKNNNN